MLESARKIDRKAHHRSLDNQEECDIPVLAPLFEFALDVSVGSKGEMLAGSRCFPLRPQQRTLLNRCGMSVRCHIQTCASYSITSSALDSSVGDTSRPSDLAIFRFSTSSNLVGCPTGRSARLGSGVYAQPKAILAQNSK